MSTVPSDLCRTVVPNCYQAIFTEARQVTRNGEREGGREGESVEKSTNYRILERGY
jgi:hypothetical protein